MSDFAFRTDHHDRPYSHVDVYSGGGGKDSKLLHSKLPIDKAKEVAGDDYFDSSIATAGRADYGDKVLVPHGARPPGKFNSRRHGI